MSPAPSRPLQGMCVVISHFTDRNTKEPEGPRSEETPAPWAVRSLPPWKLKGDWTPEPPGDGSPEAPSSPPGPWPQGDEMLWGTPTPRSFHQVVGRARGADAPAWTPLGPLPALAGLGHTPPGPTGDLPMNLQTHAATPVVGPGFLLWGCQRSVNQRGQWCWKGSLARHLLDAPGRGSPAPTRPGAGSGGLLEGRSWAAFDQTRAWVPAVRLRQVTPGLWASFPLSVKQGQ